MKLFLLLICLVLTAPANAADKLTLILECRSKIGQGADMIRLNFQGAQKRPFSSFWVTARQERVAQIVMSPAGRCGVLVEQGTSEGLQRFVVFLQVVHSLSARRSLNL